MRKRIASAALAVIASAYIGMPYAALAVAPEDLRAQIDQKNQALQAINSQIEATQKSLSATQSQGKTLSQQLNQLNGNINQLSLSIKASELNINKLSLEIESTGYDIADVKTTIQKNRDAIGDLLRHIQQKDQETTLALLLRNKSLAEGVTEMQNTVDLNTDLALQIRNLQSLNTQLNQKLDDVTGKQQAIQAEDENLKARKQIVLDQKQEKDTLLAQTKDKEAIYQQQLTALKKQQDEVSDEISQIEDELRKNFDSSLLPSKRPGVLGWPVTLAADGGVGYVTQCFGEIGTYHGRYLYSGKPHNGMDIGIPVGTPIYAADDGEVLAADNNGRYEYGKYVMIKHDNNLATLYAHLSRQVVQKGSVVHKGDLIGYSGNTGYSVGPHLHFGLYWAPSVFLKAIAPASGLVPIGVVINAANYLPSSASGQFQNCIARYGV